jgi:ectoine hydroxylase
LRDDHWNHPSTFDTLMRWDDVVGHAALVASDEQRAQFDRLGFLLFPRLLGEDALDTLRRALASLVAESSQLSLSNEWFDLEPGHTSASPKLRRAMIADDARSAIWDLCRDSVIVDIAADILGPNLRFRDCFVNFKWAGGGAAVHWHQDIAFYPHTNTGTCQFLVALEDVGSKQGPLRVIPESHRGDVLSHYDDAGNWAAKIADENVDASGAIELTGLAGSVSVHHSCLLHSSSANTSDRGRPMLVLTYAAADAIPYSAPPYRSSHYGELVRGVQPAYAHHEPIDLPLPPDWTHGYQSIFSDQHDRT